MLPITILSYVQHLKSSPGDSILAKLTFLRTVGCLFNPRWIERTLESTEHHSSPENAILLIEAPRFLLTNSLPASSFCNNADTIETLRAFCAMNKCTTTTVKTATTIVALNDSKPRNESSRSLESHSICPWHYLTFTYMLVLRHAVTLFCARDVQSAAIKVLFNSDARIYSCGIYIVTLYGSWSGDYSLEVTENASLPCILLLCKSKILLFPLDDIVHRRATRRKVNNGVVIRCNGDSGASKATIRSKIKNIQFQIDIISISKCQLRQDGKILLTFAQSHNRRDHNVASSVASLSSLTLSVLSTSDLLAAIAISTLQVDESTPPQQRVAGDASLVDDYDSDFVERDNNYILCSNILCILTNRKYHNKH